jgi:hypothetical protein
MTTPITVRRAIALLSSPSHPTPLSPEAIDAGSGGVLIQRVDIATNDADGHCQSLSAKRWRWSDSFAVSVSPRISEVLRKPLPEQIVWNDRDGILEFGGLNDLSPADPRKEREG